MGRGRLLQSHLLLFLLVRQRNRKMGDARCLLGFLATLAICYTFSSVAGSPDGLKEQPPWKVACIVEIPYLMKKTANPTKNEDYEGYVPDVLMKIGEQLHQTFTMHEVPGAIFGDRIPGTNSWTGMVGELIDQTADITGTPLAVRADRSEVLDFTEPLFSVRVILIMAKPSTGSKSIKDLVDEMFTIGVVSDTIVMNYLHNSTLPHFQKIAQATTEDPDLVIADADEGVRRIRNGGGKFAFITYSANGLCFVNRKPCDLAIVETYFPQNEFALAVANGSPIKAQFDAAVTQLRINDELVNLRRKWWIDECSCGALHSWGALVVLPLLSLVQAVAMRPRFN